MRLDWEADRAVAPDGTIYLLDSARYRDEPVSWFVLVYDVGARSPSRQLDVGLGPDGLALWPTKRRAKRLAEVDADAHGIG